MISSEEIINRMKQHGYTDSPLLAAYGVRVLWKRGMNTYIAVADTMETGIHTRKNVVYLQNLLAEKTGNRGAKILVITIGKRIFTVKNAISLCRDGGSMASGRIDKIFKAEAEELKKCAKHEKSLVIARGERSISITSFLPIFLIMVLCFYFYGKDDTKYALCIRFVENKEYYRIITYMFAHANLLHLSANMWSLIIVSVPIIKRKGWKFFTFVYLIGGIGAGIFSLGMNPYIMTIGASGAIFALYGSYLMIILTDHNIWFLQVLLVTLTTFVCSSGAGTDIMCHLGGLFTGAASGFMLCGIMRLIQTKSRLRVIQ